LKDDCNKNLGLFKVKNAISTFNQWKERQWNHSPIDNREQIARVGRKQQQKFNQGAEGQVRGERASRSIYFF